MYFGGQSEIRWISKWKQAFSYMEALPKHTAYGNPFQPGSILTCKSV